MCTYKRFLVCFVLFSVVSALTADLKNASFEDDIVESRAVVSKLSGWKILAGNVELHRSETLSTVSGAQVLDLNGDQPGAIEQTVQGLKPNADYNLKFAYADQAERKRIPTILCTADLFVNGYLVATLRNSSDAPEYIDGIGFGVRSSSTGSLKITLISTTPGEYGLLIDHFRLVAGNPQSPPVYNELTNGSFEMPVESKSDNPHLHGVQLPGWLVLRENIDLISYDRYAAPDGKTVVDLGGHGPGGIAQTIRGLDPGKRYRFSMRYGRHQYWNMVEELTGEIYINDEQVLSLSRSNQDPTHIAPHWTPVHYDFDAPASGTVTLSLFTTSLSVGGGILYDDIRIEEIR